MQTTPYLSSISSSSRKPSIRKQSAPVLPHLHHRKFYINNNSLSISGERIKLATNEQNAIIAEKKRHQHHHHHHHHFLAYYDRFNDHSLKEEEEEETKEQGQRRQIYSKCVQVGASLVTSSPFVYCANNRHLKAIAETVKVDDFRRLLSAHCNRFDSPSNVRKPNTNEKVCGALYERHFGAYYHILRQLIHANNKME